MEAVIVKAELVKDIPLEELREIVRAREEGRLRILKDKKGRTCGTCRGFRREAPERNRGTCCIRKDRYFRQDLPVYQEKPACKKYETDAG